MRLPPNPGGLLSPTTFRAPFVVRDSSCLPLPAPRVAKSADLVPPKPPAKADPHPSVFREASWTAVAEPPLSIPPGRVWVVSKRHPRVARRLKAAAPRPHPHEPSSSSPRLPHHPSTSCAQLCERRIIDRAVVFNNVDREYPSATLPSTPRTTPHLPPASESGCPGALMTLMPRGIRTVTGPVD